jgi:hypothetical protein
VIRTLRIHRAEFTYLGWEAMNSYRIRLCQAQDVKGIKSSSGLVLGDRMP